MKPVFGGFETRLKFIKFIKFARIHCIHYTGLVCQYKENTGLVCQRSNLKNLNRVADPPKTGSDFERRLKSRSTKYNFKWNQPCLNRGSNSLNSASGYKEYMFSLPGYVKYSLNFIFCSNYRFRIRHRTISCDN